MENLENVTNEIELYDVESNGVLNPEDVDGELANGEEEFDFPDNGDINEEVSISPTPRTSLLLGVNRSQYNINVRSGAGTEYSKVATMRVGESFCFTGLRSYPSDGYEWHKIEILYPDGSWGSGWYRGMTGVGYWKNNPYSTSGDKQYYILTQATGLYTPGGKYMTTLQAGDKVYCKNKDSSGTEMPLSTYTVGQDYERISYAYIDTQMMHGASHVKGNW